MADREAPLPAVLLQRALAYARNSMVQPTDQQPLWEGKIKKLDLRLYPSMFYLQGVLLAIALAYAVFALLGRALNRWKSRTWLRELENALQSEFAVVGKDKSNPVVWNGGDEACLYASGRRGTVCLHASVALATRHDPAAYAAYCLYDAIMVPVIPAMPADRAVLSFVLPPSRPAGTFAVIDKSVLQRVRHGRYDLAFARIADAPNFNAQRGFDDRFAVASEAADITDKWLGDVGARGDAQRAALGLVGTLNSAAGAWLESLVWTDQPTKRPSAPVPPSERVERLELTIRLPQSAEAARAAMALVATALDIVDALAHAASGRSTLLALRPETHNTLRRTRAELDSVLASEATADERAEREEAEEQARLSEQRAKLEKLSPAEQERRKQLEKKRAMRKTQGGVRMR